MIWLEIIKLRCAGKGSALLNELLMSATQTRQSGLVDMKTYRHAALDTDLSVHLYWKSDRTEQNGSILGIRLAHSLKEFGLVDHSVWIEDKK